MAAPSCSSSSSSSLHKLLLLLKSILIVRFLLRLYTRRSSSRAPASPPPQQEDPRKAEFLSQYREQYGYAKGPISIDELRTKEFSRLKGEVYLDHAGATLYAESQIVSSLEDLRTNVYGNPHSQSACSTTSSDVITQARQEVLNFFNASAGEYSCVFTSGATAALKLVGEYFPWNAESAYLYSLENHNSVLGIREYALAAGSTVHAADFKDFEKQHVTVQLRSPQKRDVHVSTIGQKEAGAICHLFSFPSECNFSGAKFDLNLVNVIQSGRHVEGYKGQWMVLIDAAKGCGTAPIDLSKYPADFVAISFYKIFGYPTGLGALIMRNDSARKLQKRYFGGGTVETTIADRDFVKRREKIEQWFEDGTVAFLSIAALRSGFSVVNKIGLSNIAMHVGCLAKFTASKLAELRHKNGKNVCILYGRHDSQSSLSSFSPSSSLLGKDYWGQDCKQGAVVTFNLKRSDGTWIGYKEVEKLASLNGIHLRTGCFCNPGACSKYVGLSETEIQANHEAGHVCWDDHDIIGGKPTGAIRVSFGYMSVLEESLALLDFLLKYFVDDPILHSYSHSRQGSNKGHEDQRIILESITVYPIKSCGGFNVDSWPLGDCGLLYDREWLLITPAGYPLTQKKHPVMCMIDTYIDLSENKLFVISANMERKLIIPLEERCVIDAGFGLCGGRSTGKKYGKDVEDWFTQALGTCCTLVRREPRSREMSLRNSCDSKICSVSRELSFANEGQFLLVSKESIEDLNKRAYSYSQLKYKSTQYPSKPHITAMQFRPNFVISGGVPFEEDGWHSLYLGGEKFLVLGGCNRCQMINIDQNTGRLQEESNPLLTLASYRRFQGKIMFGVLLAHVEHHTKREDSCLTVIKVGCPVFLKRAQEC